MKPRRLAKTVRVGGLLLGGNHPISVQSMTNTDTRDREATLGQIRRLAEAGCEIVRLAVPDQEAADNIGYFVANSPVPLVADIHFDYRLALTAIEGGISKIRINPGNIGGAERVKILASRAKERGIPIRIGVNAGSLEKDLLEQHDGPTPEAMAESGHRHMQLLEDAGFEDIVISLKASSIPMTVEAYRIIAARCNYPLHIGITEAGTWFKGSIRSALGLGILLWEGLGDTLRVSLTGDPTREVEVGRELLQTLGLRKFGPTVLSCPTCARCQINLEALAAEVETLTAGIRKPVKIAVMGCAVNGPGEAREADLGIAGGKHEALIFRGGAIIRKVPEGQIIEAFRQELEKILNNHQDTKPQNIK